jgi:cytochrome b6-f complex iron-sulfur subunit
MAKKRGMSRRDFFRNTWLGAMGVSLAGFGAASLGFLWPTLRGGFGAKLELGKVDDLKRELATLPGGMKYFPEARTYLTLYDGQDPGDLYKGFVQDGFIATYQKCAHLGCRVPFCATSKWFECPCHGSQYNQVGEKKGGPAPRGMDRFPATFAPSGDVTIQTGTVVPGPAIGTNTTGQEAEGPHCITGGGEHK